MGERGIPVALRLRLLLIYHSSPSRPDVREYHVARIRPGHGPVPLPLPEPCATLLRHAYAEVS